MVPRQQLLFQGLIFLFGTLPVMYSQTVSSSLQEGQQPCPGEEIIFTCETRGSPSIAWSSREYIQPDGDPLEFGAFHPVGRSETGPINPNTVAMLTKNFMDGNVQVLESTLHITTLSGIATFLISCIHGNGTVQTTTHRLLDEPGMPQNMTSEKRKGEVTGRCVVQLSWQSPDNIANNDLAKFTVNINGTNMFNETNDQDEILITTAYHVCSCATHNVSISAVNRCGHIGPSTIITVAAANEPVPDLREVDCEICAVTTESIATIDRNTDESNNTLLILVVILAVFVALAFAIGTIIGFIITVICHKKKNEGQSNIVSKDKEHAESLETANM